MSSCENEGYLFSDLWLPCRRVHRGLGRHLDELAAIGLVEPTAHRPQRQSPAWDGGLGIAGDARSWSESTELLQLIEPTVLEVYIPGGFSEEGGRRSFLLDPLRLELSPDLSADRLQPNDEH